MHQAVVRAGPEDAFFVRRLAEGEDGAVDLGTAIVSGKRSAGRLDLLRIVARQIRADRRPGMALIGRLVHVVRGDIEIVGIVRRNLYREGPLEAVAHDVGAGAESVQLRPDGYIASLTGIRIPGHETSMAGSGADATTEDAMRRLGTDGDVAALAAARL